MKTTLKTIALSLLVALSTSAIAADNADKVVSSELNVQIRQAEESKVVVRFDKLAGEEVKVKIYDAYGALIYSDKDVDSTSYAKAFNLSAYPAGKYAYVVSNEVYSVKKIVELK